MSREILLLVDALAHEKNVDKVIVFTALEMALASATKKHFHEDVDVQVVIERETGNYRALSKLFNSTCSILPSISRSSTPLLIFLINPAKFFCPCIAMRSFTFTRLPIKRAKSLEEYEPRDFAISGCLGT